MTTLPVPRGLLACQVDNEIYLLSKEQPVCWIRVQVPVRDHPSLMALHNMRLVAENTDELVRILEPIDASTVTFVFKGTGAGVKFVLALHGIAQTKGTSAWMIDTGELPS